MGWVSPNPGGRNRGSESRSIETVIYIPECGHVRGGPGVSAIQKKKQKRNSKFSKNTPCPVLIERQKQAARLIHDGEPVQNVAHILCVHRSTIWRWRKAKAFRLEWQRVEHNERRRHKRLLEKLIAEREAREEKEVLQWRELQKECEEKLEKEAAKCTDKPTKAFDNAYNAYQKALLRGYTLSEITDIIFGRKPIKIKMRN